MTELLRILLWSNLDKESRRKIERLLIRLEEREKCEQATKDRDLNRALDALRSFK